MNTTLLKSDDFLKRLKGRITQLARESVSDPSTAWVVLKRKIKEFLQKEARQKANERKLVVGELCEF